MSFDSIPSPWLSIVIPTFQDTEALSLCLPAISLIVAAADGGIETIVVDGENNRGVANLVKQFTMIYLATEAGRSRQMNLGVTVAKGEVVLFLHADTFLPQNFPNLIYLTLQDKKVVGGAFSLKIDSQMRGIRLVEWGTNLRSRLLKLPYGDQGIFVRRKTFEELGGFPPLPIMEDFVFVRKLRKAGKIAILPEAAVTSARRWQTLGIWQVTIINQLVILGYYLGCNPYRLKDFYRRQTQANRK
jgi:rSAM/selenodomain-associated transferase 2